MAELTTHKSTLALTAITGYGARCKALVELLLSLCNGFEIVQTNTDTSSNYSVELTYSGNTDWRIRILNNSNYVRIYYLFRDSDGTYAECAVDEYADIYLLYDETATVEVTTYGNDVLFASFIGHSGSFVSTIACFQVTDQFTGETKMAVGVSDASSPHYALDKLYISENGTVAQCDISKNINGLTKNGLITAIPTVFYTDSADIPLSGFVAGTSLMYYIYNGQTQMSFEARLTEFTVGEAKFVALGKNLCLRKS